MNETLTAFAYLIASVCFIMSLRGLSSPETSRGGLLWGVGGMVLAILTTVALPSVSSYWFIIAGIAIGGSIGAFIARKIVMTALPQLVAAFHSLVGLAAVCVAAAAFYAPTAFHIGDVGAIHAGSLVEMGLGVAVGAVTFTGSLVAFSKLQGIVSGAAGACGYGLGVLSVWLVRYMRSKDSSPKAPRWAWLVLIGIGAIGRCSRSSGSTSGRTRSAT